MNSRSIGLIVIGAVVLSALAFAGGAYLAPRMSWTRSLNTVAVGPGGGAGGPMANLSDEERAKLQTMSDEERRTYFQRKMGGQAPGGAGRGSRGGSVEGKVLEVADDSFTVQTADGGSQTIYTSGDTVMAVAKGVSAGDIEAGGEIMAITQPEADGVINATAVIVK